MPHPSGLLASLLVVYVIIGAVAAVLAFGHGPARLAAISDALLLLLFWPLYGPFFLLQCQGKVTVASDREAAFLSAIRHAAGTPLGSLLPDGASAKALARRLRVASQKVAELDRLLAQPDFSEAVTAARFATLQANRASTAALASATLRLGNIRRLHGLRDRFARELDEVGELIAQLTAQAELLRLEGAGDAAGNELVAELLARVEGLDQILDDGRPLRAGSPT